MKTRVTDFCKTLCGRHRSFNDREIDEQKVGSMGKELFEREQEDLLSDLKDIPRKACDRRVHLDILIPV